MLFAGLAISGASGTSNLGAQRVEPKQIAVTIRIYEYTPFCNGPDEVKSPYDRHVAELTLLSVVSAEAATPCCQRER
jgi:hypothetical protein